MSMKYEILPTDSRGKIYSNNCGIILIQKYLIVRFNYLLINVVLISKEKENIYVQCELLWSYVFDQWKTKDSANLCNQQIVIDWNTDPLQIFLTCPVGCGKEFAMKLIVEIGFLIVVDTVMFIHSVQRQEKQL